MADELPESQEAEEAETAVASEPATKTPGRGRRRWKWPLILLGIFVVLPATVFAIWTWIALSWTYSEGDRAGYVQKFSHKGWICKTWEGELSMVNIPGAAQERWVFSVRDDSIAEVIKQHMGNKVSLAYEEKRGIPSDCFGETQHFVVGVRRVP
jgi:hypothetical protein